MMVADMNVPSSVFAKPEPPNWLLPTIGLLQMCDRKAIKEKYGVIFARGSAGWLPNFLL